MSHSNITVVIQGPLEPLGPTFETIQSVKRFLPKSKIILSTWEPVASEKSEFDNIIKLLNPDQLVVSKGIEDSPIFDPILRTRSNLARMLITTNAGLSHVDTMHTLKLRTDTPLTGVGFLDNWFSTFSERDENFQIFENKIIIPSIFTRIVFPPSKSYENNPKWPAPLHTSDWAAFGITNDLKKFYGVSHPDENYSYFMVEKWKDLPANTPYRYQANYRFPPEMWLGIHSVGIPLGIEPANWATVTSVEARKSLIALISNFVVLSANDFGITSEKYKIFVDSPRDSASNMTTRDYAMRYDLHFKTSSIRKLKNKEIKIRIYRRLIPLFETLGPVGQKIFRIR